MLGTLSTLVRNIPMKFRNHSYYDGVFSTFGGGSARGSGMSSNGCGKGCSDGEGKEILFQQRVYIGAGSGRGVSHGSGYEHDKHGIICSAEPPTLQAVEFEFYRRSL